ncbi:hypothetical protein ACT29H_01270 [Thermophagus sp. OGC60D27]|uniref:hypothetical protein n=1 Tax=Thermophagus sp. OGC60D27 TaxID=3458415 RepID=UPI0040378647
MKLFIPTSSLNFNNIMSCESVSPSAFYSQRNFGYKTFEKVDLNCFENSLLLFEVFPEFQIPKSELVNYPMVIEIDIDSEYNGLKKIENGIWQIDRTVYLNPFNSNIYFFSSEQKRTTLSRSESSAETKLVNLYRNNIKVWQSEKKKFKIDSISDFRSLNYQEVENDNQKNKIKGFAYAYLIAANKSVTKETVQLKHLVKQIENLSSAIVNGVTENGTQQQRDDLKQLLCRINAYQYIKVKSYLKSKLPDQYQEVWDTLYNQFGLRKQEEIDFQNFFNTLISKSRYESSLLELKNRCNGLIPTQNVLRFNFNWDEVAIANNRLTRFDDPILEKKETRQWYQNLVNDIFVLTDITESSFSSQRSRLADEITKKMKSYIGEDEWKNHSANKYLNNLRRNIAGQEAFNINWNTGLISAIASFLLKGEDFEKLNDFLISSEIEDGRLAFGFYGCICGFANLSRVFTSDFFSSNIDCLTSTYKAIYKQLHNIDLLGDLPKEEKVKSSEQFLQKNILNQSVKVEEQEKDTLTEGTIRENHNCPICGKEMVLRKHSKGDFYGCSDYKNGCKGKRDLDFNELDDKFRIVKQSPKTGCNYTELILKYLKQNSPCKIADLNTHLSSTTTWSYNVKNAKAFIKENLANKVEFVKINRAEGIQLKKEDMFK